MVKQSTFSVDWLAARDGNDDTAFSSLSFLSSLLELEDEKHSATYILSSFN